MDAYLETIGFSDADDKEESEHQPDEFENSDIQLSPDHVVMPFSKDRISYE